MTAFSKTEAISLNQPIPTSTREQKHIEKHIEKPVEKQVEKTSDKTSEVSANINGKFGLLAFNERFMSCYGLIGFLLLWQIAPFIGLMDGQFIPPPSEILKEGLVLAKSGALFIHAATSAQRVLLGLLAAVSLAVPLGIFLAGWFPRLTAFLNPLLQILGNINAFALFPLFILLFGVGEKAKFAIIFWSSLWPILNTTIYGVQSIDPILIKAARSMGASRGVIFRKVVIPAAAPSIFAGFKMGSTTAFLFLIAAEMLAASAGMGWLVHNAAMNYVIPRLFVGVVSIALMGSLMDVLITWAERTILSYREEVKVD